VEFLAGLFQFLVDTKLLIPVRLLGQKLKPIPGLSGLYQVNVDQVRLQQHRGVWRCGRCRRRVTRRAPLNACPAYRCTGTLEFIEEDTDSYDLQLLDQRYSMLLPAEHTAMVPRDERERLENLFKGTSDAINTFVCTPTLELGVDIGQLDSVLMRNVPPLPANYWQRAGRAGRRHRMAVNVTYCRPVSHDRAYFADPPKLLAGRVDPPAFNLRNEVMVAKHVRATVITRLQQYTRDRGRTEGQQREVLEVLETCLPDRIAGYLFEGNEVRTTPFDLSPLRALIEEHSADLVQFVSRAFQFNWPAADAVVVAGDELRRHVETFVDGLSDVVTRLERRLRWALGQLDTLAKRAQRTGTLDTSDEALRGRCERLVNRMRGTSRRKRRDAEGYDDSNTYGVLAGEGFLPGYGLEIGSVLGTAQIPANEMNAGELLLPRPPAVALREYVPGNLIYANGHRFVAREFQWAADERSNERPVFEVVVERQAVKLTSRTATAGGLGGKLLAAMPMADVTLVHWSHISDDEELRFQLPVAVFGLEQDQHNGGEALSWGAQRLQLRRGVRLRLVNVGALRGIEQADELGYPVCVNCGQSLSPLSSAKQKQQFQESHHERCGAPAERIGFFADVVADALTLQACPDQRTAYSLLETLRMAAAEVLDMTIEDLQILILGQVDRDEVEGVLWDPMPGGSGLLEQMRNRFPEIVAAAKGIVADCPAQCDSSCIDCLQTFRNTFYHKHLDRKLAGQRLAALGDQLVHSHKIPPKVASTPPGGGGAYPVNQAERRLQELLLQAGFEEGIRGEQLRLDRALGTTTPDVIYRTTEHAPDEGVCIYLDGLSAHLHGNPTTAERDRQIRTWLRNNGYEVLEIAANELHDQGAMTRHFRKLAGYLSLPDLKERLRTEQGWYQTAGAVPERAARHAEPPMPPLVRARPEERYKTCLPLVPLKVAAGAFGDPQAIPPDEEWENWVAVEGRKLRPGMFVAKVVGKSLEPRIPEGSYCVFSAPVEGTRQGKIVLVQLRDAVDPESGQRYTVKRYESVKTTGEDGVWRHVQVTLHPVNREFEPIVLTAEDEGAVSVIAELVATL
jgi:hypothetical protein